MEPVIPSPYWGGDNSNRTFNVQTGDVGAFQQGDPITRWALARYLVGHALAVCVSRSLLLAGVAIFAIAALVYAAGLVVLAIFIGLIALSVLALRSILGAVLRRVTMPAVAGADARRLRMLLADTRGDVSRELRRIGLPSRWWTMPLLLARLLGKHRSETVGRMRDFDIDRVVPGSRLDELHMLMRAQAGRGGLFA